MSDFRSKKDGSHYPIRSGKAKYPDNQATTMEGIYNELMKTSKKFRNSTPRSRETTVKRVHTIRTNEKRIIQRYPIGQKVIVFIKMHEDEMGTVNTYHDGVIKYYNNGVYLVETSHGDAYATEDELMKI